MMSVTQLPHIAVPPITSSTTRNPSSLKTRPSVLPNAFILYRKARTKEIKASGVKLPLASILSKQAAEEWKRDAPLRLKFKKLADELRHDKMCKEEIYTGSKIPVRHKSQRIKTNSKARKTIFSAYTTPPSISPHSASTLPLLWSTSPPENTQFKNYSPLPHPPPCHIAHRIVSNVFSPPTDASPPSGHLSSVVFHPSLDFITSSSSSPYQSLFAYGATVPPLHAGSVPSLPHVSNAACYADVAHMDLWPVGTIEVAQLSAHASHGVSSHAPIPGFHSSYTHPSASISASQFFEQPPLIGMTPLLHPTPRHLPPSFSFLSRPQESLNFPDGSHEAVYELPARVPNPMRWMAGLYE